MDISVIQVSNPTRSSIHNIKGKLMKTRKKRMVLQIECQPYELLLYEHQGSWRPYGLLHGTSFLSCMFCKNQEKKMSCKLLPKELNKLFRQIKESNGYRLQALFDFPDDESR